MATPGRPLPGLGRAQAPPRESETRPRKPYRLAFILVFVYLIVSLVWQQVEVYGLQTELRDLQLQVESLEAANQELQEQIDYARTDDYIEQMARERLGLVRPNEVLYVTGEDGP